MWTGTSFNGDISAWDVSRVTDMTRTFMQAKLFNCDISHWDVSRVTKMDHMFFEAASFKQKLCGAAWVESKASKLEMFTGSSGSISSTVCTPDPTDQRVTRRPIPERDLIARRSISTPDSMPFITPTIADHIACPKCGVFQKSGRVSCCAPGGAWFNNCGGLGSNDDDHKWSEGVKACKGELCGNGFSVRSFD